VREWRECKLGDVARINYGKGLPAQKRKVGSVPVFSSAGITGWHNVPLVNNEGIIIGRKGTVGTVYYSDKPFFCIDTAYYIEPDEAKYDIKYLFYLLGTIGLTELNEDSAVPGLNRNTAYAQDILLPPLPEQRAIAGVLSSLDDKIALLHRQNKTLGGMAEALWRKMFVEEAEPGWKKGKLGDEMDITMGQSPPGNTYNEENQGMLFFQGRAEFGFRFPEARLYCTEPKRFAKRCDTLVSVRAPVGDTNMASEECCIGRGLAAVKHKKGFVSYTFYKIRSLRDDFDSFEQQGTVFGSIGKDDFNGIDTIIPDIKIVQQFDTMAKPLDDKIFMNSIQIRTLSKMRDKLLPKLMSGEVRMSNE
jgi:type I restriction enzyme S subunit